MSTLTKSRTRVKPKRSIRLCTPPRGSYPGVVTITVGKEATDYLIRSLDTDFGKGFQLAKIDEIDDPHHVNLDGDTRTCDCKGHMGWGHCKHSDGLAALIQAGRL